MQSAPKRAKKPSNRSYGLNVSLVLHILFRLPKIDQMMLQLANVPQISVAYWSIVKAKSNELRINVEESRVQWQTSLSSTYSPRDRELWGQILREIVIEKILDLGGVTTRRWCFRIIWILARASHSLCAQPITCHRPDAGNLRDSWEVAKSVTSSRADHATSCEIRTQGDAEIMCAICIRAWLLHKPIFSLTNIL